MFPLETLKARGRIAPHKFAGFFEGRCFEGTMWSNVRSLVCAVFLELRRRSYVEPVVYLRG